MSNIDCVVVVSGPSSLLECGKSVIPEVGTCAGETSNVLLSSTSTGDVDVSTFSSWSGVPADWVPSLSTSISQQHSGQKGDVGIAVTVNSESI